MWYSVGDSVGSSEGSKYDKRNGTSNGNLLEQENVIYPVGVEGKNCSVIIKLWCGYQFQSFWNKLACVSCGQGSKMFCSDLIKLWCWYCRGNCSVAFEINLSMCPVLGNQEVFISVDMSAPVFCKCHETYEMYRNILCGCMIYVMICLKYFLLFLLCLFTLIDDVSPENFSIWILSSTLFRVSLTNLSEGCPLQLSFYVAWALSL